MAEGGIYFSVIYFAPIIIIFYESIKRKQNNVLCLNIILITTMLFLIYISTPLMLMILAIMYSYIYNSNFCKFDMKEREDGN